MRDKKLDIPEKEIKRIIEPIIKKLLSSYVAQKNKKLVEYQISTGGKRIRPGLAIICCKMLKGKIKDVLYPAAGLEILHNYSLIVDDIIDGSELRRRESTTWFKFGKSIANCIAVDYGAAVFQAANKSKYPSQISEIFSKTIKTIMDGEILDILFERKGRENEPWIVKNRYPIIIEKDYLKMAGRKTAYLFQTCCELGGVCAKAKPKEIKALRNFGFNLGIAFQVKDDILDIFGEEKKFGKKIGKDIQERKGGNIVLLFALKKSNSIDKKKFSKILKKKIITKKDIREAVNLIKKTDALQQAQRFGEKYIKKAQKNLDLLPKNKWNNILNTVTDFVIKREK